MNDLVRICVVFWQCSVVSTSAMLQLSMVIPDAQEFLNQLRKLSTLPSGELPEFKVVMRELRAAGMFSAFSVNLEEISHGKDEGRHGDIRNRSSAYPIIPTQFWPVQQPTFRQMYCFFLYLYFISNTYLHLYYTITTIPQGSITILCLLYPWGHLDNTTLNKYLGI